MSERVEGAGAAGVVVTSRRTVVIRTERVTLEAGPIMAQPYSRASRKFRVEQVVVEFARTADDDDWVPKPPKVHGPVLKADGSPTLNVCSVTMWPHEGWPDWMQTLVAELAQPTAAPSAAGGADGGAGRG